MSDEIAGIGERGDGTRIGEFRLAERAAGHSDARNTGPARSLHIPHRDAN
jgi:hypothetical protein